MWIKKEAAFEPIVQPDLFYTAQGIIRERNRRYTDEELIERLRALYENRRLLSGLIIDETENMPSAAVYMNRFGSLIRAYQMVGFTPDRDYHYLEVNRLLRRVHPVIVADTEAQISEIGGLVVRDPATDLLRVNQEFSVSVVVALSHHRSGWSSVEGPFRYQPTAGHHSGGPLGPFQPNRPRLLPPATTGFRPTTHQLG
jgi:hypothetical protein